MGKEAQLKRIKRALRKRGTVATHAAARFAYGNGMRVPPRKRERSQRAEVGR